MFNNPYNYYPYMNIAPNIPNGINMASSIGRGMGMNPYIPALANSSNLVRPRAGLLKGLSTIKWGDVLNNTQKTLNVINQAIPVYYQIKPMFSNVKSFGRLMTAFNEEDHPKSNNLNNPSNNEIKKENSSNSPTFFMN